MKTKEINIYEFEELKPKIQEKVLTKLRYDDSRTKFLGESLTEYLTELLKEKLQENKIKEVGKTEIFYSLSYCQGDGLSINGLFEYKDFIIKSSGRHSHKYTMNFENRKESEEEETTEKEDEEIKNLFYKICDELEKRGYEELEHQDSDETIKEYIENNELTFRENGEIEII